MDIWHQTSTFSLTRRTLLIVLGSLLGSLLFALILAGSILHRSLASQEQEEIEERLTQLQSILKLQQKQLADNTADWANWDDVLQLVTHGAPGFRRQVLIPEAFHGNHIDFMAFLNLDGQLVEGASYQNNQVTNLAEPLRHALSSDGMLGRRLKGLASQPEPSINGLAVLAGKPTLISLQPIRNSQHSGPIGGWLIWGFREDERFAALSRELLSHSAHIAPTIQAKHPSSQPRPVAPRFSTSQALLPPSLKTMANIGLPAQSRPIGTLVPDRSYLFFSGDQIVGHRYLADLDNAPALVIETRMTRTMLQQGQQLLLFFLGSLLLSLGLFAALTLWLLKRHIGQRLAMLRQGLRRLVLGNYNTLLQIPGRDEVGLLGELIDRLVHNKVNFNRRLATITHSARALFCNSPNPMLILAEQQILDINSAAVRLFGYPNASDLVGQPVSKLHIPPKADQGYSADMLLAQLESQDPFFEWEFVCRHGHRRPCEVAVMKTQRDGRAVTHLFIRDISERKHHERKIKRLAYYDPLTEQANASLLKERLHARLREMRADSNDFFALLLLSIDQFKAIHTTFGQQVTDQLLVTVTAKLAGLAHQATLAHLEGEQFVVFIPQPATPYQPLRLARELRRQLAGPIHLGQLETKLSVSIGVVIGNLTFKHATEVLRNANFALSKAQERGSGQIQLFNGKLQREAMVSMLIRMDMPLAMLNDELTPYYQPIVDARSGQILGFEALARWQHPKLGAISPATFIPIAESSDLIITLGEHMLRSACSFIAECNQRYPDQPGQVVHVNISARHFALPSLVTSIRDAIQTSGIQPSQLVIEITESLLMAQPATALAIMRQIKALGVGLALDDFGTGYSSLSTLSQYPVDAIKLDQTLVWQVMDDYQGTRLVYAIVNMIESLGFSLITEGVETRQQDLKLRRLGVKEMQGFLFYRPLARTAAIKALADNIRDKSCLDEAIFC